MLADLHRDPCGNDALPVCLVTENSNRLVSLWDIVNQFNCAALQIVLKRLYLVGEILNPDEDKSARAWEEWSRERSKERGEEHPAHIQDKLDELRQIEIALRVPVTEAIDKLGEFCTACGFDDALNVIRFAGHHMRGDPSPAEIRSELRHLEESLFLELTKRKFLLVTPDRVPFLDQDELFGADVAEAFPSAQRDLTDAGNCFAADNSTACVSHLMKAAEIALRALAKDRNITYPYSSVDEQQWGQLVAALESKLTALRAADKKLWPSEATKNEQIRYYHAALMEFRAFNEVFRKYVSHAGSFYDGDQALSVLKHVKAFMQGLAGKLSETSAMPEYWTAA